MVWGTGEPRVPAFDAVVMNELLNVLGEERRVTLLEEDGSRANSESGALDDEVHNMLPGPSTLDTGAAHGETSWV